MKQTFQTEIEQEVSLDRSVGNIFSDLLESKNLLSQFDELSTNYMIRVSSDGGRIWEVLRDAKNKPLNVKDVLKMVIKPSILIDFKRKLAGG